MKYFRFEINKDTLLFKTENKYLHFLIFISIDYKLYLETLPYEINIRNYNYR